MRHVKPVEEDSDDGDADQVGVERAAASTAVPPAAAPAFRFPTFGVQGR
jgi:hypothetical protein